MIILHRINGYTIFILYALGAAGGIIMTPHAYAGHIDTQTAAGALAILVFVAFVIAWLQIRRLQIDQHRKWMLRAVSMMASIVSSRIILRIATEIMADIGTYHEVSTSLDTADLPTRSIDTSYLGLAMRPASLHCW